MITQTKVKEDIKNEFATEISLSLMSEKKLLDFVQKEIMQACKPECFSCFDKGYTKQENGQNPSMLYCPCNTGQALKDIIAMNYNPK